MNSLAAQQLPHSATSLPPRPALQFSIREMLAEDMDAVLELLIKTPEVTLLKSETKEMLNKGILKNPGFCHVAFDINGTLIGCCFAGHNGFRGCYHHLAVAEEYRMSGIAKEMVEAAFPRFTEDGIARVYAMVRVSNQNGKKFWNKMGFRLSTPENEGEIVTMTKDL